MWERVRGMKAECMKTVIGETIEAPQFVKKSGQHVAHGRKLKEKHLKVKKSVPQCV